MDNNTQNETVVLLSDKKVDGHTDIDLDVEKLEGKSRTATYKEIKEYVQKTHGLKVPNCPPDKEEAIMDAFRHFNLI